MSGRIVRDQLVAADAGDLLGDVGLDRDVAAPRRHDRDESAVVAARIDRQGRGFGPAEIGTSTRPRRPAPSRSPTRASSSRCSSAGTSVPSSRLTRAGRNATRAGSGSSGARVDAARRDGAAGPLGDEPRGPVRADAREPELLALLEAEAGLAAEGVALAGPADRDRIEDRRLDDDVASSCPSPRTAASPMTPAIPTGPRSSAIRSVSASRSRSTWSSVSIRSPGLGPADDEAAPAVARGGDRVGVVRVDRLAELEHHVVRASTTLLIGRTPAARRRIWTRSGDGPIVTPPTQRPTNRGQSAVSRTSTVEAVGRPARRTRADRSPASGPWAPVTAATSRASPTSYSASPRFGLTSTSSTSSPYRSASARPSGASAAGSGSRRRRRSGPARRPSRASRC